MRVPTFFGVEVELIDGLVGLGVPKRLDTRSYAHFSRKIVWSVGRWFWNEVVAVDGKIDRMRDNKQGNDNGRSRSLRFGRDDSVWGGFGESNRKNGRIRGFFA